MDIRTLSLSQLVKFFNERSPKPVKTFKDKPTALRRVSELLDANPSPTEDAAPEDSKPAPEAPAPAKSRSGSKVHYPADHRVLVVATGNPKRAGSASAARFALYHDGMTVGEYVAACTALEGAHPRHRQDVLWDVAHGHIKVYDPQEFSDLRRTK